MFRLGFAGVLFIASCAQMATEDRLADIRADLDPQIGHSTKQQIAQHYGPPDQTFDTGSSQFWTYVKDYGSKHVGVVSGHTYIGHSRARYDRIILEFQGEVLANWKADVQR